MSFIRGLGIVILSVFLFLTLLIAGVCLTLGMSLTYENVNPTVVSLSGEVVSQTIDLNSVVAEARPVFVEYCKANTEYVFSEGDQTFVIPCSIINEGNEQIINYLLNDTVSGYVSDYYYKQYDCKFINCIREGEITALISKEAHDYWMSKFYLFLIISCGLIVLLFLLCEKITGWFFLIGSLFIIDALIISKLNVAGTWVAKALLTSIQEIFSGQISKEMISQVVSLFFLKSITVFYIMLGVGIAMLILGVIFNLFKIGMKIHYIVEKVKEEDTKEEVKQQVKEEVKQEVKEEVKQEVKEELKKEAKQEILKSANSEIEKDKKKSKKKL